MQIITQTKGNEFCAYKRKTNEFSTKHGIDFHKVWDSLLPNAYSCMIPVGRTFLCMSTFRYVLKTVWPGTVIQRSSNRQLCSKYLSCLEYHDIRPWQLQAMQTSGDAFNITWCWFQPAAAFFIFIANFCFSSISNPSLSIISVILAIKSNVLPFVPVKVPGLAQGPMPGAPFSLILRPDDFEFSSLSVIYSTQMFCNEQLCLWSQYCTVIILCGDF